MAREHVWQGVVVGIARFAREVDSQDIQEKFKKLINNNYTEIMVNNIWKLVEPNQSQNVPEANRWHPRGQRLFAEMFTVGEMSRELLGEDSLSDEKVQGFVRGMPDWLNSFFHVRL